MRDSYYRRLSASFLGFALVAHGAPGLAGDRVADVPTYRGDAARTGLMPGPGPSGTPGIIWSFQTGAPIASQAVVAEETVYVVTVTGSVHALEVATGSELWQADMGAPSTTGPTISEGLAVVATDDGVVALDARNGGIAWSSTSTGPASGTPAVVEGNVVTASVDGMASALDAAAGDTVWQTDAGITAAHSVAADPSSGIAVLGGHEGIAVAVELVDGRVRWRYDTGDSARTGAPTMCTMGVTTFALVRLLRSLEAADEDESLFSGSIHGNRPLLIATGISVLTILRATELARYVARTDDKRRARLDIISHLLCELPYEPLGPQEIKLPRCQKAGA